MIEETLATDVGDTVVELAELAVVPAVGGTDEVASDALELVYIGTATLRTYLKFRIGILVAAVEAAVAVVVYAAIAHVELVHHVDYAHDDLWVVGGITVNLYIEDVSSACEVVVWCLYLCLVAC